MTWITCQPPRRGTRRAGAGSPRRLGVRRSRRGLPMSIRSMRFVSDGVGRGRALSICGRHASWRASERDCAPAAVVIPFDEIFRGRRGERVSVAEAAGRPERHGDLPGAGGAAVSGQVTATESITDVHARPPVARAPRRPSRPGCSRRRRRRRARERSRCSALSRVAVTVPACRASRSRNAETPLPAPSTSTVSSSTTHAREEGAVGRQAGGEGPRPPSRGGAGLD